MSKDSLSKDSPLQVGYYRPSANGSHLGRHIGVHCTGLLAVTYDFGTFPQRQVPPNMSNMWLFLSKVAWNPSMSSVFSEYNTSLTIKWKPHNVAVECVHRFLCPCLAMVHQQQLHLDVVLLLSSACADAALRMKQLFMGIWFCWPPWEWLSF